MKRSFANPRILVPALFASTVLFLIISAYVERPRVEVGFGGIADTISIQQEDIKNARVRSASFRDELKNRLTSPQFIAGLRRRDPHLSRLVPDGTRVVVRDFVLPSTSDASDFAATEKTLIEACTGCNFTLMLGESYQADIYLTYIRTQCYRVSRPGNPLVEWFQERLPFMPDPTKLAAEADAANETVKHAIRKEVEQAVKNAAATPR
jgi:hypothetical protein